MSDVFSGRRVVLNSIRLRIRAGADAQQVPFRYDCSHRAPCFHLYSATGGLEPNNNDVELIVNKFPIKRYNEPAPVRVAPAPNGISELFDPTGTLILPKIYAWGTVGAREISDLSSTVSLLRINIGFKTILTANCVIHFHT